MPGGTGRSPAAPLRLWRGPERGCPAAHPAAPDRGQQGGKAWAGRAGRARWQGPAGPEAPCLAVQIQVFLLGGSRKRVLVRVERATVFSVEQENVLDGADAYYLGGAPVEQLPWR